MLIRSRRGWEVSEHLATPERDVLARRAILATLGAGGMAAISPAPVAAQSAAASSTLPATIQRNAQFQPDREISPEREVTSYNNYYEFGTDKAIHQAAQRLRLRPWTVKVDGLVDRPREFDIDDLLMRMPLEERVYRLRCVEAWAMIVPWIGFPLVALLKEVGAQSGAKYVRFETAAQKTVMPGLRQSWFPWPYVEGCTIDEAANDLSFLVVGAYGKPLPPQNGGPLRIHQPWKYGFKAGKSLVRISLTAERPKSFWEVIQPSEYGFWANVNPEVAHSRWSQATERLLGSGERVPTRLFNGYGEYVASLYTNLQRERLWA
jgi:sulfoxide reductase catalytic subunit YedY